VAGGLVGHLQRRELAQLLIDQRQQFIGGMGVALLDAIEDAGHIAHADMKLNCVGSAEKKVTATANYFVAAGLVSAVTRLLKISVCTRATSPM